MALVRDSKSINTRGSGRPDFRQQVHRNAPPTKQSGQSSFTDEFFSTLGARQFAQFNIGTLVSDDTERLMEFVHVSGDTSNKLKSELYVDKTLPTSKTAVSTRLGYGEVHHELNRTITVPAGERMLMEITNYGIRKTRISVVLQAIEQPVD